MLITSGCDFSTSLARTASLFPTRPHALAHSPSCPRCLAPYKDRAAFPRALTLPPTRPRIAVALHGDGVTCPRLLSSHHLVSHKDKETFPYALTLSPTPARSCPNCVAIASPRLAQGRRDTLSHPPSCFRFVASSWGRGDTPLPRLTQGRGGKLARPFPHTLAHSLLAALVSLSPRPHA